MRSKLIPPQSEWERRIAWREQRLLEAGFPPSTAQSLGPDMRFDLHALFELVDQGCPPDLAVRIVAPLDWEEATT